MPGERTFAIADDLTGALEIGAKFAAYDLRSEVATSIRSASALDVPVVVVDAETRHVPPDQAAACTREAAALARQHSSQLVYKKTDSTLRGNIAAEFSALQDVFPERRIVYAPAYPELGRTVKNGKLFVHGKPVHETEFAHDRWSPVRDCRVQTVLGDVQVIVLDGECKEDIDAAAVAILAEAPPRVCAGPAALAGALARQIGSVNPQSMQLPRVSRCLVVNGSLHPASIVQIATAVQARVFDGSWTVFDPEVEGSGRERAARVGECVRNVLKSSAHDALIVFGGDTAFGVHEALGSVPLHAIGEIAPGIAVSKSAGLLWITKAGGFGPPDILTTIRKRLT